MNATSTTRSQAHLWFARTGRPAESGLALLCFPHAGGGPAAFGGWPRYLPEWVDQVGVHLPGRGRRLAQPPIDRLSTLVEELGSATAEQFGTRPLAFFAHSMGTLVAFELARWLRRHGLPLPIALIVSGREAPDAVPSARSATPLHLLPDGDLAREIDRLDGTPAGIFEDAELAALLMPALRADLCAAETYRYLPEAPLDCPIAAFGGRRDPSADPVGLARWAAHTSASFRCAMFEGGHFYLQDREADVVSEVTAVLERAGSRP